MRKGLTPNIEAIIDNVSQLECIKPYTLCGGTALAIQLGHRMSEDLDFMMSPQSRCVNFWYNILTSKSLNQPTKNHHHAQNHLDSRIVGRSIVRQGTRFPHA